MPWCYDVGASGESRSVNAISSLAIQDISCDFCNRLTYRGHTVPFYLSDSLGACCNFWYRTDFSKGNLAFANKIAREKLLCMAAARITAHDPAALAVQRDDDVGDAVMQIFMAFAARYGVTQGRFPSFSVTIAERSDAIFPGDVVLLTA